jgi:hypothetical protein
MKRFAKLLLATLGFSALGLVVSLVPQKAAKGSVAAQVQVVNTPLPVAGNVNATINGTPTVNVASMPAINVGQVTLSGNVPVVNPVTGGNPVPLQIQDADNPTRQSFHFLDSCTFVNTLCQDIGYNIPLGKTLVVEDISGYCTIPQTQFKTVPMIAVGAATEAVYLTPTVLYADSNSLFLGFGRSVKLYAPNRGPNATAFNQLNFVPTQSFFSGSCNISYQGYLVNQ